MQLDSMMAHAGFDQLPGYKWSGARLYGFAGNTGALSAFPDQYSFKHQPANGLSQGIPGYMQLLSQQGLRRNGLAILVYLAADQLTQPFFRLLMKRNGAVMVE